MDFITSDTHIGHQNIISYCNRPWATVDAMTEGLIENWNAVVGPQDTVYHLGDFAMGQKDLWAGYRARLNGKIVFMLGNHDTIGKQHETHPKFTAALLPGDVVYRFGEEYVYTSPEGITVSMEHLPLGWNETRGGEILISGRKEEEDIDFYFCGHVHQAFLVDRSNGCVNVGVDMWDYRPRTLAEILDRIR